jgi:hypothetical protein
MQRPSLHDPSQSQCSHTVTPPADGYHNLGRHLQTPTPKPFKQLIRDLQGGCDDLLSSTDDLVKNWGLSDSTTYMWIECSSDLGMLSRNHGMLSIARRSDTVHRFSCDTKTRSWRNCGDEWWAVDGEQQTWTRLGASDDHSRLDRMSLLTNALYLASLGRGWSQGKYCVSSTKNMTPTDHTS